VDPQPVETTLYSLSDTPPGEPRERRDGDRMMTLYRVGSLLIGDSRELCLIKNISAGGMMVRCYGTIAVGTSVSVELKCGQPIGGRVSWVRDIHVGIAFDQPIDVIDVLSTSLEGPRPRLPRIEVNSFITLREGATTYRMRVSDVSQGGLKVQHETRLAEGSQVVVTLTGIEPQPGVVRWTDGDCMGITFNRMIALPTLVEWLREQRQIVRRVS
jgi:PilZ domain